MRARAKARACRKRRCRGRQDQPPALLAELRRLHLPFAMPLVLRSAPIDLRTTDWPPCCSNHANSRAWALDTPASVCPPCVHARMCTRGGAHAHAHLRVCCDKGITSLLELGQQAAHGLDVCCPETVSHGIVDGSIDGASDGEESLAHVRAEHAERTRLVAW